MVRCCDAQFLRKTERTSLRTASGCWHLSYDGPADGEVLAFRLQVPHVLGKLCGVFVSLVPKTRQMVGISLLERSPSESDVVFLFTASSLYCSLVNYVGGITFTPQ